jgi:2',3'-cyclic-nucleotide 2'-phosphodiesterase (5'-nucleotidase family)
MANGDTTLHIIHTNDFHNSLNDTGAAKLRQAVADLNGAPYLLLDAGDAIKAGNVGVNPFGEPILDTMSDLGYHAMTMGNREFHVWKAALSTKINRAKFPILCANVRAKTGETALSVVPNVMLTVGGLKVAVFGVTVPMVTERMRVAALSHFVFDDPIETARKQVTALRYHADVLIALTHIGLREDEKLAREVGGIDLVVGGHSHVALTVPLHQDNAVPVVQAGWHARLYGHTQLTVTQSGVRLSGYALHPLQEKAKGTGKAK